MKILKNKVYRYANKTYVDIKLEIEPLSEDKWGLEAWKDVKAYQEKLDRNIKWMGRHLLEWSDYDQHFTLDLFCDSLQKLGEGLIRWDNLVHSLRNGRRAIYAAHLLRNAYETTMYTDKCIRNHLNRCPFEFKKYKKGLTQMVSVPIFGNAMGMDREEYEDKMYRIAIDRCRKIDEAKIDYAWAYIKKHIVKFWD